MDVSFCVVNTNGGELLARCLDAIAETCPDRFETETLVIDNASDDGSAEHARGRPGVRLIELAARRGKAANDSQLLREARGRYCLLLNEDSELLPGAVERLVEALEADTTAGAAGSRVLDDAGVQQPSAWRFTSVATALAGALFLHKRLTVQSRGDRTRVVDWAQSCSLLVRREAAAAVGFLDEAFFVYGDEVDLCKRMSAAGWHTLYVPAAAAYHREGLSHGASAQRRIVEFHRGRDRYMRKHHGALAAMAVRWLVGWTYLVRAAAATVMPGHSQRRFCWHLRAALRPAAGEGLREAAERFNRERSLG